MRKQFTKDGKIRSFEVVDTRVFATIEINGVWVSNPTLDVFYMDGWKEYTPPTPTPYVPTYEEKVVQLIRERYSIDDELAIQRQRDSKPSEFAEYNAFCEECKQKAKAE